MERYTRTVEASQKLEEGRVSVWRHDRAQELHIWIHEHKMLTQPCNTLLTHFSVCPPVSRTYTHRNRKKKSKITSFPVNQWCDYNEG